ncbi:MAG: carboxylesterase family protein [Bacteroidales bacterium]|nr:carboxylesterase family protein [Bacteroidales bacterium]
MKHLAFFSFLALAACTSQPQAVDNPILTIEGGQVQGVTADDHPDVFVYRGIPYAAPPIGELRWKEPQPVVAWEGVKIADQFGHPSYQSVHYPGGYTTEWGYGDEAPYSEDCLYLNVWTKAPNKQDAKLPVALWIHGGGYREGWGSEPEFDGQEWGNKDVVLVSINYRLGVFGFLTHPLLSAESPHGVSGNYGILDQIEALKWIRKNISQFGGDPENVTIFGQSAGAGSVKTLCESPLARGYFQKAVIMSGGGITMPGAQPDNMRPSMPQSAKTNIFRNLTFAEAQAEAKIVLDWAGLTDLEKMRRASTEFLYSLDNIYRASGGQDGVIAMRPIVDGYVSLESFDQATLDGSLADVPYMIGYTQHDLGNMGGGIADFCRVRAEKGGKAWAYQFARPLPDDGSHPEVTARLKGAFHSSDLWYVFKSLKHCWRPWTKGDWDLSERMLTYWSNFVKYSNPNGLEGDAWAPLTAEQPNFMVFKLDAQDAEASAMGEPIKRE